MGKILMGACYLVALPVLVLGEIGLIATDAALKVWHALKEINERAD